MKRVTLEKGELYEKTVQYEIIVHNSPTATLIDSEIRRARQNSAPGHYLIERHHLSGAGIGGFSSYQEVVGLTHKEEELPQKIYECAVEQAKSLARRLRARFEDKTKTHAKTFKQRLKLSA